MIGASHGSKYAMRSDQSTQSTQSKQSKQSDRSNQPKSNTMCAPDIEYDGISCARLNVLVELARAYNSQASTRDHIRLNDKQHLIDPRAYKQYIVDELTAKIGDRCDSHKCWSRQEFVHHMEEVAREEYLKYTFRPDSPQGKFQWLNTHDINNTMAQYERKYPHFKFFGAVPMDFLDFKDLEINNYDYAKNHANGITSLGIVFNFDTSNQPGSHWVAMFTDLKHGRIYYFDSFATRPKKSVTELIRIQHEHMVNLGHNPDAIVVDHNKVQHQKEGSECGVYSINFLIRMARGDDFHELCNKPIRDRKINKCRKTYFSKK